MSVREKLGWWLRCAADRIDRDHAVTGSMWSFTYENGIGAVVHENRNQGCPLWAFEHDRERAYAEADNPPRLRVNWKTMQAYDYASPRMTRL